MVPVGETVSPARDRQSEPAVSTQQLTVSASFVAASAPDDRLIKHPIG